MKVCRFCCVCWCICGVIDLTGKLVCDPRSPDPAIRPPRADVAGCQAFGVPLAKRLDEPGQALSERIIGHA
ncbi:MAG: hypothetical protein ABSD48_03725 [Armatimonadota bacterium]